MGDILAFVFWSAFGLLTIAIVSAGMSILLSACRRL